MSAAKLALFCGAAAAALLAALWLQRDDTAVSPTPTALRPEAAGTVVAAEPLRSAADSPAQPTVPVRWSVLSDTRVAESDLRARAVEQAYSRFGSLFVDHLVARGLAQADGEIVVRRFSEESVRCLFDALRAEAEAQTADYDSVL